MTIQLDPSHNKVRVRNVYLPVSAVYTELYPLSVAFRIPLGETGRELSIAIGTGSYSSNKNIRDMRHKFDLYGEMETVEVGFEFDGRDFDVRGYVNDEELLALIAELMNAPRGELGTGQ